MKKVYMTITLVLLLGGYLMTVGYGDEESLEEKIWKDRLGKEPIWGNTFQDLAISVSPKKDRYTLGEDIEILVLTKNFGENEAHLRRKRGFFNNFRLELFGADERPVAKSEYRVKREALIGQMPTGRMSGGSTMEIGPGRTASAYEVFSLNEWFKIEKEGTYSLVVIRPISSWDWDKGFLISNAAKIIISNSESPSAPDQHHTPQEDNILGQDRFVAGKYVVIGGLCTILIVGCIALLKKAIIRGKSRAT